jgi:glycerol-3-phosphate acyltransferase PlsY
VAHHRAGTAALEGAEREWPLLVLAVPAGLAFAVAMVWLLQRRDLRKGSGGNAGATNVPPARAGAGGAAARPREGDGAGGAGAVRRSGGGDLAAPPRSSGTSSRSSRLRGGKGATAADAAAILLPGGMLSALVVFALVVATTRYVSLGSIVAARRSPRGLIRHYGLTYPPPVDKLIAAFGIGLLVLFKHQ